MHQLRIEKSISKDVKEVFKSLKEGRLFMNCSADSNSLELDFRVGGKYFLNFKNHKVSNWGEFIEIIPDKKIVFTWCQAFGPDQKPDTKVIIELFAEGAATRLVLEHQGFKDQSTCDNHYQGWSGGLTDLSSELETGRIRLLRRFGVPVGKLFQTVTEAEHLFGKFQEVTPDQRITLDPNVTLLFTSKEDKTSALELTQEGLTSDKSVEMCRKNWDQVTAKLTELLHE